MLQPPSRNDLPPLATTTTTTTITTTTATTLNAASTCGMQQQQQQQQQQQEQHGLLIIQRPTAINPTTFDWSDFPVVQRDAILMEPHDHHERMISADNISTCSSDSDFSTASSATSVSTVGSSSTSASTDASVSSRKSVSFSPKVQVRRHNIVLGDHPCCQHLALELSWDHAPTEWHEMPPTAAASTTSTFENERRSSRRLLSRCRPTLRRRSYFERKAILKEMGMTDEEIRYTTLAHAAPSTFHLQDTFRSVTL